ncbi:MAG: VCBS repeat-containing protein [Flavobacteriaceae bacterium]
MRRILGLITCVCLLFIACEKKDSKLFRKLAASQTGVDFSNNLKDTPELNILTYLYYFNGAGVAAADFNKDGLIDLYFTSNLEADKLYLNEGGMKFKDITKKAGIEDIDSWSTGVTYVDINGDGLLDIYVCKASGYRVLKGRNLLYENQGVNSEGIPVFKENAASYGLGFSGLSTQASFFDYDLDGDLDLYLMNHSVHPNRAYGRGAQRTLIDARSGDRLYQNVNGYYKDISEEAGIYQGKIGYGLGLGISDMNQDGYPDIYVGNDFFENDYLYLNNRDGTFKEIIAADPTRLGHTTHYSMGNDLSDINNDGFVDIVSLDMLPENLETYKASGLEFPFPAYHYYLYNGYSPQFMQNTLHLNLGDATFSEIGHLSGIAATEWSWSALLADYDNDGLRDLYISNGIKGATNDMDFVNFISNDEIQRSIDQGMTEAEMNLIDNIPETKVPNYFYKNKGELEFENVSSLWANPDPSFSHGAIYADLDNDGDLDLVVNNVNEKAYILENTTDGAENYIQLSFLGNKNNSLGIGNKVKIHAGDQTYFGENFVTRGYLSSVPPILHFGLGQSDKIDSLKVIWPTGHTQTLIDPKPNQHLSLNIQDAEPGLINLLPGLPLHSKNLDSIISYRHRDQTSIEFNRNPLIPFASTNEGPGVAVADVNRDGLDDIFLGGAKKQASSLFLQDTTGLFTPQQDKLFQEDIESEDVSMVFFDADQDGWVDLLVVSGGNEYKEGIALQPRLYRNKKGTFTLDRSQFTDISINASKVGAVDFDKDGDLDITITADLVPWDFGKTAEQYLFENDGSGHFTNITAEFAPDFRYTGNVKDFVWQDLDGNGYPDLITAGLWMPVQVFLNSGKSLILQKENGLEKTNGWWSSVAATDFDQDGDIDIVAGNFGENSLLKASDTQPVSLYRQDFDDNGSTETLVTYFHQDRETALASKDELVKQMPFLNKEFLSYQKYARASLRDLFGSEKLEDAEKKFAYTLGSFYYENDGKGGFTSQKLPAIAQASTIKDIGVDDLNKDGYPDIFLIGNNYEISTQLGSMDASHGVILQNNKNGGVIWVHDNDFNVSGPARNLNKIRIQNMEYYIIGINNAAPIFIPINN